MSMVYAALTVKDEAGFVTTMKIVAKDVASYQDWKSVVLKTNKRVDEFIDFDFGTVCVLPEDFKYW